ncbi:MAG: SUMF1/EgtB/PvdO family nonheme iron enzyme [Planctomycetes bacterium]|nr:SUMF1/EgtB/PvdO family nonheme iron enzyme [Planctomycetota bacterium]
MRSQVSVFVAALLLAPSAAAQSAPTSYCTAGGSTNGCTPQISANAQPNVSSTSGCILTTLGVEGQRQGLTFYGVDNTGFTPTPWAPLSTSLLCVKPPTVRFAPANSGGTLGACNGALAFSWDAFQAANPGALGNPWTVGDKVFAQTWYRDPLAARGTNLSNALELTLQPPTPIPCITPLAGMRLIPSGTFSMGSAEPFAAPYFSFADEKPVRQVTITYCFWMGEREVSQSEYVALMGSFPFAPAFPDAARPVENITWQAARNYCNALTAQQTALGNVPPGYQYRLPTEAEWEYACRAGTTSEFHYGGALSCSQARITFSYHPSGNCGVNSTTTVGTYVPNAWGLYDMHGNVAEWCLDAYAPYAPNNVTNPFVSVGVNRVNRGGAWSGTSSNARSAARGNFNPLWLSNDIGFRVVLAPIINVP